MSNGQKNHLLVYTAIAVCLALAGTIQCARAQSDISGEIRKVRVQGTVTEAQGEPLHGAIVLVEQIPFRDSPTHDFKSVETSVGGRYEFELNLKPGDGLLMEEIDTSLGIPLVSPIIRHAIVTRREVISNCRPKQAQRSCRDYCGALLN